MNTTVAYKNISTSILHIGDLDDTTCLAGNIKILHERNTYDDIISSKNLYNLVFTDQAIVVLDGLELDKKKSLEFLKSYSSFPNKDHHSGFNVIDAVDCLEILPKKEMMVSSLTINGILIVNGILTII